jgi:hypothetical protein
LQKLLKLVILLKVPLFIKPKLFFTIDMYICICWTISLSLSYIKNNHQTNKICKIEKLKKLFKV